MLNKYKFILGSHYILQNCFSREMPSDNAEI